MSKGVWAWRRLFSNAAGRRIHIPAPAPAADVLAKLDSAKASGHHEFWADDLSVTDTATFQRSEFRSHHQVTDVYLLALAAKRGGRLVTFDQNIPLSAITGAKSDQLVVL